jgi:ribosomal protein L7/L12
METVLLELAAVVITIVVFLGVASVTSRARERRAIESGIYPPPGEGTDADVQQLIMRGEYVLAITLYREIHRVGMKEAKDAVDTLREHTEAS